MNQSSRRIVFIVVVILVFLAGLWYGNGRGYKQAEADIKATQQEAAKKAAADAAKAANPFQATNPIEGVEANPFEKTKQILNPFE